MKILIYYYLILNILAFVVMGLDKRKAKKGSYRISESFLLSLAAFSGGFGTLVGMYTFHHKTKKKKFYISVPLFLILHIVLWLYLWVKIF